MVVTDEFIVLHVPKTGGNWIDAVCGGRSDLYEPHTRWIDLAPEHQRLPAFVVVRNPWDWYVSWWSFCRKHVPDAFNGICRQDFPKTVKDAIGFCPSYRKYGYYGYMFWQIVGRIRDRPITVGRFENLREDFLEFLETQGASPELRRAALTQPHVNVSERRDYRDYYDEETAALVEGTSGMIISRFGYEF